jgi:hypothetical protein
MDEAAIIEKIKQALREQKKVSPTTKPKDPKPKDPKPKDPKPKDPKPKDTKPKPKPKPNPPKVTKDDWDKLSEALGNKRVERNKSDES